MQMIVMDRCAGNQSYLAQPDGTAADTVLQPGDGHVKDISTTMAVGDKSMHEKDFIHLIS